VRRLLSDGSVFGAVLAMLLFRAGQDTTGMVVLVVAAIAGATAYLWSEAAS
jgi:hypothetical protein